MDMRPNPERLKAFLADPARPKGTLSYHELQGFLFALACSPDLVRPSEWMPEIFAGAEAEYADMDEANVVLGALMALYNEINAGVFAGEPSLPADCPFRRSILANFDDDAPISQWARGFIQGHQWLEESWDIELPDEMDYDFGAVMMALTFFASRRLAEDYLAGSSKSDLPAFAQSLKRIFSGAMESYALLGRTIADARRAVETERARRPTAGRNEPCPCGSGRKYKKCCGAG